MSAQNQASSVSESKAGAGAAGVGGGTLVVVMANSLPESSKLKPWLLLAAPSVSVFLSAAWLWLQVRIANFVRDREAESIIASAKRTLEEALRNPNTSEAHRAVVREKLEQLELVAVSRQMERISALKVIPDPDF